MEFTAKQIAEFVGGRVEGNENATVNTFAKIEEGKPGALSFLSNPKYTHYLYETKSSAVATTTTASGRSFAMRHLMSRNFSAPRSAPKPASVTV